MKKYSIDYKNNKFVVSRIFFGIKIFRKRFDTYQDAILWTKLNKGIHITKV